MKAKVLIERLELHAYHGWHPHEGEFGQPYTIDVELLTDVDRAAGSDHLSDTMDYGVIVETISLLIIFIECITIPLFIFFDSIESPYGF